MFLILKERIAVFLLLRGTNQKWVLKDYWKAREEKREEEKGRKEE